MSDWYDVELARIAASRESQGSTSTQARIKRLEKALQEFLNEFYQEDEHGEELCGGCWMCGAREALEGGK